MMELRLQMGLRHTRAGFNNSEQASELRTPVIIKALVLDRQLMQHFYDGQIRRYITQMIRLMSNFSYKDGKGKLVQVPVMYGDLTRQVSSIIRDNSENKLPSAPRMAVYVTGLEMDRTRTSDSSYVNKLNIRERAYD